MWMFHKTLCLQCSCVDCIVVKEDKCFYWASMSPVLSVLWQFSIYYFWREEMKFTKVDILVCICWKESFSETSNVVLSTEVTPVLSLEGLYSCFLLLVIASSCSLLEILQGLLRDLQWHCSYCLADYFYGPDKACSFCWTSSVKMKQKGLTWYFCICSCRYWAIRFFFFLLKLLGKRGCEILCNRGLFVQWEQ